METKFQTSFIPKKSVSSTGTSAISHGHGMASIFMTIAVIIFIASLAAAGGAFAWKQYLLSQKDNYSTELSNRKKQFNTDLIEQLNKSKIQIDTASTLLQNHLAMSQIFSIISRFTIEPVRFLNLDISAPTGNSVDNSIKLSMRGYGTNLSAVAFQSDVLGQLETIGLRKVIKNPIISDPTLDSTGRLVSFGLSASIDPASLSYVNSVSGTSTPNQ